MRLAGAVMMVVGLLTAGLAAVSTFALSLLTRPVALETWVVHLLVIVGGCVLLAAGAGVLAYGQDRRIREYEEPFK